MARIPMSPRHDGPDHHDGPGEDTRLGGAPRVTTLTPGSAAALAALVVVGVYFGGSPTSGPAKRGSLNEPQGRTRTLTFVADGGMVATTSTGDRIRRWRVDAQLRHSAPWGEALPGDVPAFSADGATVAIGDDSIVRLWSASEDRPRHAFRTGAGRTYALAFDRDGGTLAAASERAVTLWDTASGRRRAGLPDAPAGVISLAFTPDGRSLATGGKDGYVRLWELESGRQRVAVRAHDGPVSSLAVSDDGRTLASMSKTDRTPRLWELATGRGLATLRGHTANVQCVAFAPGGATVAATAADGTVRLWDVPGGRQRATLREEGFVPSALAFSPDGRTLVAGGFDETFQIWDLSRMSAGPAAGSGEPRGAAREGLRRGAASPPPGAPWTDAGRLRPLRKGSPSGVPGDSALRRGATRWPTPEESPKMEPRATGLGPRAARSVRPPDTG